MAQQPFRLGHMPVLDGIRALAILIVFVGHTKVVEPFPSGFGVTLFFTLSGYLITTLLRIEKGNNGNVSLSKFYIRRLLRINPPLWISMILAGLMIQVGMLDLKPNPGGIVGQALFVENYVTWFTNSTGLPMPLWSLAVEEHFYLLFPAIFILASRYLPADRLGRYCLIACAIVLAIRLINILVFKIVEPNYYLTHTRIDSILFGCALALWRNPVLDPVKRPPLWLLILSIGVILATFVFRAPLLREGLRYSIQGAATLVLFSAALQATGGPVLNLLTSRPMRLIGTYSYTLYLVHYPILVAIWQNLPGLPRIAQGSIAAAASMAVAYLMYRLVERPLARVRHRLSDAERPVDLVSQPTI